MYPNNEATFYVSMMKEHSTYLSSTDRLSLKHAFQKLVAIQQLAIVAVENLLRLNIHSYISI